MWMRFLLKMIILHKITCSLSLQLPISYASILNEDKTCRMIKSKAVRIWKVVLIVLGIISLSSGLIRSPGFWSSYLLDIAGPAWMDKQSAYRTKGGSGVGVRLVYNFLKNYA